MDATNLRLDRAQALLEDVLARNDPSELSSIESLVAANPELESDLRELWRLIADVDRTFEVEATAATAERQRLKATLQALASSVGFEGRYEIQAELGRGGMGVVLSVMDNALARPIAMKLIAGQSVAAQVGDAPAVSMRQLARFLNEAKLTGQLDHPGIVPVHEVGVDADGRAYFTMKLVKGLTLAEVFERKERGDPQWPTPRVLSVIERVCEAMAFAHQRAVIHRDLKPANIMVGDFGEVYVMDWGLARRLGEAEEMGVAAAEIDAELSAQLTMTRDGAVIGTPAYMSPEQARGEIAGMGPQSDVYSLGAMLYQLIVGAPPHIKKGEKPSGAEVLARVLTGPPKSPAAPTTPPELIAICEKAMAAKPAERYVSVRELAGDINRFVSGRTVRAFESGTWAETKKWVRRNKALAVAIAAVLFVSTGAAVAFQLKANESTTYAFAAHRAAMRALLGEKAAQENAEAAQRNATAAQIARDEATQKANDVLSLSAQKDLDDLVAEAGTLWPAHPAMLPRYAEWLARARELIDGRPAQGTKGFKRRPGLTEHEAKLAELRLKAKPLTKEQARAEREAHPQFAELEAKQAELLWRSRMLGLESWPVESEVDAELARESLPTDADALNVLAWPLVDPAKPIYGQEVRALLLARRAVAAAAEAKRGGARNSLAWALVKLGRFDEAAIEEWTALKEPGGEALADSAKRLAEKTASWRGDELENRRSEHETLARDVVELEQVVSERQAFEYDEPEAEWWDRQLSKLVNDLEAMREPKSGLMGDTLAEPFGWGVEKRYEFAKTIDERSVTGPEAATRWSEAIAAIKASPKYAGLEVKPQLGLLPIGADLESGLWEFAHLQTGEPAVRGSDGKLVRREEMGLVFVLIQGGKFWMGSQKSDPDGPNYDPQSVDDEGPVHEVELSPYFLSKYEMTQGQWLRIAATNPSMYKHYKPPNGIAPTLLHPMETVSWVECSALMEQLELSLPSEAQWEFGARGGSSTPWWTGDAKESLVGKVNIADQSFVRAGGFAGTTAEMPELDDGSAAHSEVGHYAANGFGLHEVAGNVWEWCLDGCDDGFYLKSSGKDPVSPSAGFTTRVIRGGGFGNPASSARSAWRNRDAPGHQGGSVGLRPSRRITP